MKLFTVRLTDDERAKLEAFRVAYGLRSQSDVIRHWIARNDTWTGRPPAKALTAAMTPDHTALALRLPRAEIGSRLKKGKTK